VELVPQFINNLPTKYTNILGRSLSEKVVDIYEGNFFASPVRLYDKQLKTSNDKKKIRAVNLLHNFF